jgi:EAL domain-containing protein (putative c-di-GMP-specific phosphodiesterase class I)
LDFLKLKHCGEGQGFFLSKPLEAKQMQELLANTLENLTK